MSQAIHPAARVGRAYRVCLRAIGAGLLGLLALGLAPAAATAAHSLPAVVSGSTNWGLRFAPSDWAPTTTFTLGTRPVVPFTGDWDANGSATPGTYSGGVLRLYNQIPSEGTPAAVITFGDPRGFPVAGDFDGDGRDDVAIYRNGTWQIRLAATGATSTVTFGTGAWPATVPVAGDWDGDGTDGIGTYTLGTGTWNLRQTASSGVPDAGMFVFWADSGSYPVVGDWDGNGTDTVGVKHTMWWLLNNQNDTSGYDLVFAFGAANDLPLAWKRVHADASLTLTVTLTPKGCRVTLDGEGLQPDTSVQQTREGLETSWTVAVVGDDGTFAQRESGLFHGETTVVTATTAHGDRITSDATCPRLVIE